MKIEIIGGICNKVKGMFLVLAARGTRRAWFSQVVNVDVERGSLGCVV